MVWVFNHSGTVACTHANSITVDLGRGGRFNWIKRSLSDLVARFFLSNSKSRNGSENDKQLKTYLLTIEGPNTEDDTKMLVRHCGKITTCLQQALNDIFRTQEGQH